jgi:hypothetical protein
MAIIDEMNPETSYLRLEFVEMLEFICRAVDFVVKDDASLDQKLMAQLPVLMESNRIRFSSKVDATELNDEFNES